MGNQNSSSKTHWIPCEEAKRSTHQQRVIRAAVNKAAQENLAKQWTALSADEIRNTASQKESANAKEGQYQKLRVSKEKLEVFEHLQGTSTKKETCEKNISEKPYNGRTELEFNRKEPNVSDPQLSGPSNHVDKTSEHQPAAGTTRHDTTAGTTRHDTTAGTTRITNAYQCRQSTAATSRNVGTRQPAEGYTCPRYQRPYLDEIFQCASGHSACGDCKAQGLGCGNCSQPITDMRILILETIVDTRTVPCPNASAGCTQSLMVGEQKAHLSICEFIILECPISIIKQCNWKGNRFQLHMHMNTSHKHHCQARLYKELALRSIHNELGVLHYIKLGPHSFLMHIYVSRDNMFAAVQMLAQDEEEAKVWTYEIHLYNKQEPRRSFVYADTCQFLPLNTRWTYSEAHSGVFPLHYVRTMLNNGVLHYKFNIKKVCDNEPIPVYSKRQGTRKLGKPGLMRRGVNGRL